MMSLPGLEWMHGPPRRGITSLLAFVWLLSLSAVCHECNPPELLKFVRSSNPRKKRGDSLRSSALALLPVRPPMLTRPR